MDSLSLATNQYFTGDEMFISLTTLSAHTIECFTKFSDNYNSRFPNVYTLQEYSQSPITPSPHFRWEKNIYLINDVLMQVRISLKRGSSSFKNSFAMSSKMHCVNYFI